MSERSALMASSYSGVSSDPSYSISHFYCDPTEKTSSECETAKEHSLWDNVYV